MCGIVGYISLEDNSHPLAKRHFSDYALMLDTLRGSDSTGIIRVENEFDVHTLHTTMSGTKYVQTEEYDAWMKERPSWAMIGHNRAATAGSVKVENAHPFTFGEVTMVHNGTLWNKGRSMPGFDPNLEVDSMLIAKALSEIEPTQEAVKELLSKIDGSYALVWVDRRDDSINMCRNSSRPMHFGFNQAKDIMFFMSDGTHLRAVVGSLARSPSRIDTIYSLDKNKLLKFKKGTLVPEVADFRPFVPKTTTQVPKRGYGTQQHSHGSALQRAKDRWQKGVRKAYGKTQQASSGVPSTVEHGKCWIGKNRRSVPHNHRQVLKEWYDLEVDDLVPFKPNEWIELADKTCIVFGEFLHEKWGDGRWPMTVYGVPLVCVNAYSDFTWQVKVKGVGSSYEDYQSADVISVVGELHQYDIYDSWEDEKKEEEEEETADTGLVVGPEEVLMERAKCMGLLSRGCIQCSGEIDWLERVSCVMVNEGRDVLCPECTQKWSDTEGRANA